MKIISILSFLASLWSFIQKLLWKREAKEQALEETKEAGDELIEDADDARDSADHSPDGMLKDPNNRDTW